MIQKRRLRAVLLAIGALGSALGFSLGCELVLGLGDAKDRPDAADAGPRPDVSDAGKGHDARDAGPECKGDASQCACDVPQTCVEGTWQGKSPCLAGTVCVDGDCVCTGRWCAGRFGNMPTTCVKGVPKPSPMCGGATPTCDLSGCIAEPASCTDGGIGTGFQCGSDQTEDCCIMRPVSGGTFMRSYDGVTYKDPANPATVTGYRMSGIETTVGRFRSFTNAWTAGWRPAPGSGKHTQANEGAGLAVAGSSGMFETGWQASWDKELPTTSGAWNTALVCDPSFATWTPGATGNERDPINCVQWYEAYAFCIWDGGFLPSEAEWNYAASDGCSQRVYPWSVPPDSGTIDYNHASYNCNGGACSIADISSTGKFPGLGKWLHAEMSGNVAEWTLDYYVDPYPSGPCVDCAALTATTDHRRVIRGGAFNSTATDLLASARSADVAVGRLYTTGFRCAAPLE